jgi:hypothetical protein
LFAVHSCTLEKAGGKGFVKPVFKKLIEPAVSFVRVV